MKQKILSSFALLLWPLLLMGQGVTSYECTMDGNTRRVVILTEPGVTVPCEVQYHKDTEAPGQVQVLWSASSQADYCQSKAAEFVDKLGSLGWSCSKGDSSAASGDADSPVPVEPDAPDDPALPEDEETAIDDTSALEPGD
jgi:hypothetical protein